MFENYVAISGTTAKYFKPTSSVSTSNFYYDVNDAEEFHNTHPVDSYNIVEIYDLNSSISSPIHYITSDMVQIVSGSGIETGVNSFGMCVSMNKNFLVVGDPFTRYENLGLYRGCVHIFSGSIETGFVYHSSLTGSNTTTDVSYGYSVKIDRNFNKIVVGNGNIYSGSSGVYLYELIDGVWQETKIFRPTKSEEMLEYINLLPTSTELSNIDCFGNSVAIYCDSNNDVRVAVGAPMDRVVYGYETTESFNNGAVYVFEKINCVLSSGSINISSSYYEEKRLAGDSKNFRDNRLGHSVSMTEKYIIASSPRICAEQSSSFIQNTFYQQFTSGGTNDGDFQGLVYIYEKNEDTKNWQIISYYKPRKVYGIPHKFFGYSTAAYSADVLIGSPVAIIDHNREMLVNTGRNNVNKNLQGNFNLINIDEYNETHQVGNVFYKNGIIVISTSGSAFDSIFETNTNDFLTYDLKFDSCQKLYQKEIICTINTGEFNRSTNPTSYYYNPSITLDVNNNNRFDFDDCDMMLRFMSKYSYNTEHWWEVLNIYDQNLNKDYKVESSRLEYYISLSQRDVTTNVFNDTNLLEFKNKYITALDTNDDGVSDKNDMYLLWKYFANTLSSNNYIEYLTKNSFKNRRNYDDIISHLHLMCGKTSKPTSLPAFTSTKKANFGYSSDITLTSSLCPYITTVGLYDGADLVAVAKLGTPIKNNGDFPLNIIVRFDY